MRREKSIAVRFSGVGGDSLKAEMRGIGQEGQSALQKVVTASPAAAAGIDDVGQSANRTKNQLDDLAAKAAQGAAVQARALNDIKARYDPVFAAQLNYKRSLDDLNILKSKGRLSTDEYTAALGRERDQMQRNIMMIGKMQSGVQQMDVAVRRGNHRMQQMFYQVNDVGVSLAGGMNPFLVMAQQGTQIAQIYGFGNGGVAGALKDVSKMIGGILTKFPLVTIAAIAGAAAIGGMTSSIQDGTDVAVNFGDVTLAVFQVVGRGIYKYIKPAVDKISGWLKDAWDLGSYYVILAGNHIIKTVQATAAMIGFGISAIPGFFLKYFAAAKANVFFALSDMLKQVNMFLRQVAEAFNSTFNLSLNIPRSMETMVGTLDNLGGDALIAANEAQTKSAGELLDRLEEIKNGDPLGDFYDNVMRQSITNANDRLAEDDDETGGGSAARQRDEVQDLIKSLTLELAVMRETDPVKRKLLELSEQMADATAAERREIEDLVASLQNAQTGYESMQLALAKYAQDAQQTGSAIGDAITSGLDRGVDAMTDFTRSAKSKFKELTASIIQDLVKIQLKQYVVGPLAGALSSAMGSVGADLGSATLGIPQYASGVANHPGGFARVHDGRGGEIMDLPGGTRVYPYDLSRQMVKDQSQSAGGQAGGGQITLRLLSADGVTIETVANTANVLIQENNKRIPEMVQAHNADPRKRHGY